EGRIGKKAICSRTIASHGEQRLEISEAKIRRAFVPQRGVESSGDIGCGKRRAGSSADRQCRELERGFSSIRGPGNAVEFALKRFVARVRVDSKVEGQCAFRLREADQFLRAAVFVFTA